MPPAELPSGVLADRYDTRSIVIWTEAGRAAVTGLVVVALITGLLSLPVLLGAAVLLGTGQAVKGSAQLLLMRSVVPPGQLTAALTQDEVRINGTALVGPALGGALYGIRALAIRPRSRPAGKERHRARPGSRPARLGGCWRACVRSGTSRCSVRPRCSSCS